MLHPSEMAFLINLLCNFSHFFSSWKPTEQHALESWGLTILGSPSAEQECRQLCSSFISRCQTCLKFRDLSLKECFPRNASHSCLLTLSSVQTKFKLGPSRLHIWCNCKESKMTGRNWKQFSLHLQLETTRKRPQCKITLLTLFCLGSWFCCLLTGINYNC